MKQLVTCPQCGGLHEYDSTTDIRYITCPFEPTPRRVSQPIDTYPHGVVTTIDLGDPIGYPVSP